MHSMELGKKNDFEMVSRTTLSWEVQYTQYSKEQPDINDFPLGKAL